MKANLIVEVLDINRKQLPGAKIEFANGKGPVEISMDSKTGRYESKSVSPGNYKVKASFRGMQSEERLVSVSSGKHTETFVLGEKGLPFYYRGKVQVPFKPMHSHIAVTFKRSYKDSEKSTEEKLKRFGFTEEKVDKSISGNNTKVLSLNEEKTTGEIKKIISELSEINGIKYAGQIVEMEEQKLVYLSDELVVKFKGDVDKDAATGIIKRLGGEALRVIPYLGNAYEIKFKNNSTYDLLDICRDFVKTGRVEYAEPNLVNIVADLEVNPTDILYASQWHIPLIDLPDAWQSLSDIDVNLTFGSPSVLLSVMDRGIVTTTAMGVTSAAHPDFQNTLTDGSAKVIQYFDFDDMVANNDTPPNDHGMGCAGVAGAMANNSSSVAGEEEGVSGAAPNCQLMGIIRPAGGTETEYSDAFIWQAGFNPGSITVGFPAPLARGADIITNSYAWGPWPISGLMTDTMNYLTTYGRNGKGTLLFFASGNGNTDFRLQAGLSAHPRTFAIAASTDGDVRAWYSNFGDDIDVCAPSNGGVQGIFSADLLNQGNVAGHTGGNLDYRNDFGGTSSATPLVAGISALMLSVNPALTWVEVRQILRDTAIKIDPANINATGRWVDTMGRNSDDPMYSGPFYSQWYGYGRIDADAAVNAARDYDFTRDILIRDNLADSGLVPSAGAFWDGADIWVRKIQDDVTPANYMAHANTVHEQPDFGSPSFLYVRLKNIGVNASYPFTIRAYITHWPGAEFTYPSSFIPSVNPGGAIPSPLVPGTYLIGEASVTSLAGNTEDFVSIPWAANLVPPEIVTVDGMDVTWHPCLLVEVSPHDGFTPTGTHIWENNNLAQKNISINYDLSASGDFAFAGIAGRRIKERTRFLGFEIKVKWPIPRDANAYILFKNKHITDYLEKDIKLKRIKDLKMGTVKEQRVFYFNRKNNIKFYTPFVGHVLFIIGGHISKLDRGDTFTASVTQLEDNGKPSGGLTVEVRGKSKK